ncbi:hypothetical protein [Nonomuraea jiangxiensis]|uniref:Uncharacterized protein n=1 Tax=Nonomuraea jiangxiensis TaxID=633440 RepID=A0A1G9JGA8_9ACTN|nr:hypothetical protein [Nonomuraea jiangxiensis]SDL36226.1 hypothetical protein SAMN05421869_12523 [Nonomuraea jiangxiensis]
MIHRPHGPREEEALRRTLKDIDDRHLTLWVRGRFYDEHTGAPLDPPQIEGLPDRQPQPGVPGPRGAWWTPLIERGWLELSPPGRSRRYLVTDAGRDALAHAHGRSGQAPVTDAAEGRPSTAVGVRGDVQSQVQLIVQSWTSKS